MAVHACAALKKDVPEFDVKPLLQEAESKYSDLFKQADEVVAASKKRIGELEQELQETAAAKVRSACQCCMPTLPPNSMQIQSLERIQ